MHPQNWYWGWALVLGGFVSGAVLGLRFDREDFWGGYSSLRRRLARLGHIAMVALGLMNVIFAIAPWPAPASPSAAVAATCLQCGGIAMPLVCFLAAWRPAFCRLFFIPVLALVIAVIAILLGGVA